MRLAKGIVVLTAALLLFTPVFSEQPDSVTGPPPIAVDTFITNDATSPVPVVGDVTAEITGQVGITSVPPSLTDPLATLVGQIEQLTTHVASINARSKPANYAKSFSAIVDQRWAVNLPKPVMVSLITVSTQDDEATLWFCDDASELTNCAGDIDDPPNITLGERKQWPSILVVPFPQPVRIQSFQLSCGNIVENCEFTISILGTELEE